MPVVDEDSITLKQAEEVPIADGTTLSRRQIHHLCKNGKLIAQKVGSVWLVSRKSIEAYKPEATGFAAVWKKRRTEEATLAKEIKEAIVMHKAWEDMTDEEFEYATRDNSSRTKEMLRQERAAAIKAKQSSEE